MKVSVFPWLSQKQQAAGISLKAACRTYVVVALLVISHASSANAQTVLPVQLKERGSLLHSAIMPEQFRGRWSVDVGACGTAPIDDSQVRLTAKALDYYETNGHVVRIAAQSDRRLVVTLKSEGGGMTFTAMKGLTLSPDGHTLMIRDQDDTKQVEFQRCPSQERHIN